jgi:hypothetical protein
MRMPLNGGVEATDGGDTASRVAYQQGGGSR